MLAITLQGPPLFSSTISYFPILIFKVPGLPRRMSRVRCRSRRPPSTLRSLCLSRCGPALTGPPRSPGTAARRPEGSAGCSRRFELNTNSFKKPLRRLYSFRYLPEARPHNITTRHRVSTFVLRYIFYIFCTNFYQETDSLRDYFIQVREVINFSTDKQDFYRAELYSLRPY